VSDPEGVTPSIAVFAYGPDQLIERSVRSVAELQELRNRWPVIWVNVAGLGAPDVIRELGDLFAVHHLAIGDIVNVYQRSKVEEYGSQLFFVTRMHHGQDGAETEQVSLVLGRGFLLTFQERPSGCFEPVRERLRKGRGRLRRSGADYLMYALVDTVVDVSFPALERYGERLQAIEDEIQSEPGPGRDTVSRIYELRRELMALRRLFWPQREAVSSLMRDETPLIAQETRVYLRDCYDHTVQLIEFAETLREIASGLMEFYISRLGQRTNEVMKVLTMISTVFIPLTFIAGVYGMNFDRESPWNMPELGWRLGYPLCLCLMGGVAVGTLVYFRRKGWL
jgi:magnesium transporter